MEVSNYFMIESFSSVSKFHANNIIWANIWILIALEEDSVMEKANNYLGTIPKRCELVRKRKKAEQIDKNVTNAAKWKICQFSGDPLRKPVIACRYGR
jgi:hypothetical protein